MTKQSELHLTPMDEVDDIASYVATFSKEEQSRLTAAEAALDIAMFLHDIRERRGLSQSAAAQRAGLQQQAVSRLEQPGANPRLETIRTYLDALGFGLEFSAVDHEAGQVTATVTLPLKDGEPRSISVPVRTLIPSAAEEANQGYALLDASEVANRQYTIEQHERAVALWGRALTLYREGVLGTSDVSKDTEMLGRLGAKQAQIQLLSLGVNSAKAALDLALAGYYSPAFATIRHMIESFAQYVWLVFYPGQALRWFDPSDGQGVNLDPPRMREMLDQIKADLVRRGLSEGRGSEKLERVYRSWKLMSKGSHPSGEGLVQTLGAEDGQFLIGGRYQPDLCLVALDHGLFAVINLLLQALVWTKPQSADWMTEWERLESDVSSWRAEMAGEVSAAEERLDEAA